MPPTGPTRDTAGAQTRARLIEATARAFACHGEAGVSLRAVSREAGANVAAVKYHFGSRQDLIRETVRATLAPVFSAQAQAVATLDPGDPPDAWICAWATPLLDVALATGEEAQRRGRIVSRVLSEPEGCFRELLRELGADSECRLRNALHAAVPELPLAQLELRIAILISALAGLATGAFDERLRDVADRPNTGVLASLTRLVTARPDPT